MTEGILHVVATPIGNLDDLTPRAAEVLREADLVAAEDTRVTGRLLSHFGIKTPQMPLHEHNEERQIPRLIGLLERGSSVALVSDAGTPLISDPGFRLVAAAHRHGIRVSPVPGPSAAIAALSVAGLATDRFVYAGFLPPRGTKRKRRLQALAAEPGSVVLFESVHRIAATVDDLVAHFGGDRPGFIGRELTKLHEQCVTGGLAELASALRDGRIPQKGEFVLVLAGTGVPAEAGQAVDAERLIAELVPVLPLRQAVDIVVRMTGQPRNRLYQLAQAEKERADSAAG